MSEITVTFNLLPELEAALEPLVQAALNQGAADIATTAQELVDTAYPPASQPGEPPHRRTGELQGAIRAIPDAAPLEAWTLAEAPYSAALEFGAAFMAARPFLTPAVEQHRDEIVEHIAEKIGEVVTP